MAGWTGRRTGALGTVCLALVLTACAQESDDLALHPDPATTDTTDTEARPAADSPSEAPEHPMQLLWTAGGHFATRPVPSGEVLVALLAEAGHLSLVAYRPADGTEVWRRPSTASDITPGVSFPLLEDDGRVFHLVSGSADGAAAVEAVDAASGEQLWLSAEAPDGFNDPLDFCGHDRDTLCVTAGGGGPAPLWRLDVETGANTAAAGLAGLSGFAAVPPPGSDEPIEPAPIEVDGRALGGGLYDLRDSRDIARVVDGEIVWQRSPSELFEGRSVGPDYGWMIRESGNLLVVWLGSGFNRFAEEIELPQQYTAGIDAATGATRWVADGNLFCGKIVWLAPATADPQWLRCLTTGTVTIENDRLAAWDVDNVLEEFDPATGDVRWTVDLGPSSGLFDDTDRFVRLSGHSFGLMRDDGSLVGVDLNTGQTLDLDPDDVGWCIASNSYDYDGSSSSTSRAGEEFTAPCNLGGGPQPAPLRPDQDMGVVVDGVFVWMDEAGLHGARVPD